MPLPLTVRNYRLQQSRPSYFIPDTATMRGLIVPGKRHRSNTTIPELLSIYQIPPHEHRFIGTFSTDEASILPLLGEKRVKIAHWYARYKDMRYYKCAMHHKYKRCPYYIYALRGYNDRLNLFETLREHNHPLTGMKKGKGRVSREARKAARNGIEAGEESPEANGKELEGSTTRPAPFKSIQLAVETLGLNCVPDG
jgi:hypothetical protein